MEIVYYNRDKAGFINPCCSPVRLATGFQFAEGPVWHPGGYLLFSDTIANNIYQLWPDGRVWLYLPGSGFRGTDSSLLSDKTGSNALALDSKKRLVFCQHGNHAIARLDDDGITILTDRFAGRPFNSPNDIAMAPGGDFYFSDPPYGLEDEKLHPDLFQPLGGVYHYDGGSVQLVCADFDYPNGLCISPGGHYLYVGSSHPDEPCLRRYTRSKDGSLHDPYVLMKQNADGIKTDPQGRIYMATMDGILVATPEGVRLALLPLPEMPTNMAFGGDGGQLLFVTTPKSVYTLSLFG